LQRSRSTAAVMCRCSIATACYAPMLGSDLISVSL
jgi:hypothetical protein